MPYLQATIKEALRIHPAVGLLLERKVPREGCKIAGAWMPGGTIVGINPWVLHRDKDVFGADADIFRPERWLEAEPEALKIMDRSMLAVSTYRTAVPGVHDNKIKQFGSGPRTCIGRNTSLLEMSKIVPQLLWTFEVSFLAVLF